MIYKLLTSFLLYVVSISQPQADNLTDINRYLINNSNQYAFLYFTKTGCSYCDDQKLILKQFIMTVPWQIREVNISNRPDVGQRFDIEVTPTLVLVSKNTDKYVPLTKGVQTSEFIKNSTVRGIALLKNSVPKKNIYLIN